MATIINNPSGTATEDTGALGSILIGIIAVILAILFIVYAVPALRDSGVNNSTVPAETNVNLNPAITPATQ